jgi:hypothetical protein
MTEACKTIRKAVIETQKVLAAHVEPYGALDAKSTISALLKVLDGKELLQALAETAD